jgi:ankyrin repeat protein
VTELRSDEFFCPKRRRVHLHRFTSTSARSSTLKHNVEQQKHQHNPLLTMNSTKVMKSIIVLLDLIGRQDWELFQSTALSNPAAFRAIANAIRNSPDFYGMTLLHAVARYNPPLNVVTRMISICPDQLAAKDCLGRTPLHVAAGSSAEPRLIKFLAHAYPASCDATDEDGKTPLHFACDSSCELFEDDDNANRSMPREVCHKIVHALLSESLHAATIEDLDEMNACEYAILSDAELRTVKLLQSASCKSLQSKSRSSSLPLLPLSLVAATSISIRSRHKECFLQK